MSKLRRGETIQIESGKWYVVKKSEISECCGCGLRHVVYTKVKDGKVYQKWNVLDGNLPNENQSSSHR
jgi:translation elongation factor P/translation initiation factor 5A